MQQECSSYKDGCGIQLLRHLKQVLAWATDKRLLVIKYIMLFKNSNTTKELKNKPY